MTVITHEQCISRVVRAQHVSYLQNFSSHEELHAFFVNLDVNCSVLNQYSAIDETWDAAKFVNIFLLNKVLHIVTSFVDKKDNNS